MELLKIMALLMLISQNLLFYFSITNIQFYLVPESYKIETFKKIIRIWGEKKYVKGFIDFGNNSLRL